MRREARFWLRFGAIIGCMVLSWAVVIGGVWVVVWSAQRGAWG